MTAATVKINAVVTELNGALTAQDASGNIRNLKVGDTVKNGEILSFNSGVKFSLANSDGTVLNETDLALENIETTASTTTSTNESIVDNSSPTVIVNFVDTNITIDETSVVTFSEEIIGFDAGDLTDYLSFSFSGGNTTISIDADGIGTDDDVTIVLNGVDLSSVYSSSDAATIIAGLTNDSALIVDPNPTNIDPYDQNDPILP